MEFPCIANMTGSERSFSKEILEQVFNEEVKKNIPVNIIVDYLVENDINPENILEYKNILLRIKIAFSTSINQNITLARCPYCGLTHAHRIPPNNIGFAQPLCPNSENYIIYVNQKQV